MGAETMISLWEHFGLFVLLSLLVTLVYSGLRQDDMHKIIRLALRRFLFFMLASAVLGVAVYFFALGL
jgi:hypothetical protein